MILPLGRRSIDSEVSDIRDEGNEEGNEKLD
jgi:hypothetical protein